MQSMKDDKLVENIKSWFYLRTVQTECGKSNCESWFAVLAAFLPSTFVFFTIAIRSRAVLGFWRHPVQIFSKMSVSTSAPTSLYHQVVPLFPKIL